MTSPASACEEVDHTSKITTTLQKHSPGMQTLLNLHHVLMIAAQNDSDGAVTRSTPKGPGVCTEVKELSIFVCVSTCFVNNGHENVTWDGFPTYILQWPMKQCYVVWHLVKMHRTADGTSSTGSKRLTKCTIQ